MTWNHCGCGHDCGCHDHVYHHFHDVNVIRFRSSKCKDKDDDNKKYKKERGKCEMGDKEYKYKKDDFHRKCDNEAELKQFDYDEPLSYPIDSAFRRLEPDEEDVLAVVEVCPEGKCDLVWFAATVGWRSADPADNTSLIVEFRIRKGSPEYGAIVFATRDMLSEEVNDESATTTSFIHVENARNSGKDKNTKYYLTAKLIETGTPDGADALITGPVVFTAAVLK